MSSITILLKNGCKTMILLCIQHIMKEYKNTYHRTIKIKPIDVKDNTYINIGKTVNDKDLKFKVDDHVRISKYKIIFAKGYTPNWSEKIFCD